MSFWGSLFGGQNSTLSGDINQTGQLAGTASKTGTDSLTKGTNFFSSILSGDPTKIGQALAPTISAGQKGAQEQKKATAEFGNRGGGNNAKMQSIDATTRGNITNLVGGAQTGAASTLLNSGQNLLSTALGGYSQQADLSQKQMENWQKSILGSAVTGAVNYGESFLPVPHGG